LGAEVAVEFWGGNAGRDAALRGVIPVSAGRRAGARVLGWAVLVAGAGLLALGVARRRRRGLRLGAAAVLVLGWGTLALWPPLWRMTPEVPVAWLLRGAPVLPAALTGPERARAERGEYVATIAPCGLCHTPAGAFVGFYTDRTLAGGMEGRWRVYGS